MGKHDKPEVLTRMSEEEEKQFLKARIERLEKENKRLREELMQAKKEAAGMTGLYEKGAAATQTSVAKKDAIIKRKNDEIKMAKEAIYLAAMREVALR